ncbi:hypothetical protein [Paenarthrobacter ureafaciens]|uniref:hypothetical protein n=1 Tax=Paenarthrobacter ureafaciens TaxID=37931 RepID=UPI001FB2D2D0|nr:hypothetical protein [Paenarthrobacter ureafaciens]UOD80315.1 hypothetical protein MQZ73_14500 [Paenarthrobacter ureafaciens]WNZ04335.1 hypothetical protein PVT25_01890 [Paenarthrobacter ureafaciens]
MAGKVTVRAELSDGTIVQYERSWNGGNPRFEGAEAESAARNVAIGVRESIEATHGKLPEGAHF